jgi:hypothetical protein
MSTVSVTLTYDTDDIDHTFRAVTDDPQMSAPAFITIFDDEDNLHTFNPANWSVDEVAVHAVAFASLVRDVQSGNHPNEAGR